jgi:hypothetical protein
MKKKQVPAFRYTWRFSVSLTPGEVGTSGSPGSVEKQGQAVASAASRSKGGGGRGVSRGKGRGGCVALTGREEDRLGEVVDVRRRTGRRRTREATARRRGQLRFGERTPHRRFVGGRRDPERDTGCRCRAPNRQILYRYGSGRRYREPLRCG